MITLNDLNRILQPIKKKIFLLLGRAVLSAINNDEQTQKIQVVALNAETITDIERPQEYGFESYPKNSSEAIIGFINGNRDQGIVLCIHDRRYRPQNLSEGEVAIYNYTGNIITMKQNGEVHILYDGGSLEYAPLSSKIKDYIDNQIKLWADTHVHSGVTAGGGNTGIATTQFTAPTLNDLSSSGVKIS